MTVHSIMMLLLLLVVGSSHGEMLGKLIFHGDNHGDKSTLNILHQPSSINIAPNPGPLPSNEVASVLALSLGMSVPKDVKWAGLQVSNPFTLPKAAVMISVDNLPKGHSLNLPSSASFAVETAGDVSSVGDMYNVAPKYSLPSHINGIFEGTSKILTVSADEETAASGHSNSPMSETCVWSELTKTWKVVGGNGEVKTSLSHDDILDLIPNILIPGFSYRANDHTVHVNTKGLQFTFNLDDDIDFKLFSELIAITHATKKLSKEKGFSTDGSPDLFLLSVSALKGLEKKYGSTSLQIKGALLLIEHVVEKTVASFVELYRGNVFVVGVTVPSEAGYMAQHANDVKTMMKVLEANNVMVVDLDNTGSEIHLMDKLEKETERKLCREVQGSLSNASPLHFKCAHDMPVHKVSKRSLLQLGADAKTTAAPTAPPGPHTTAVPVTEATANLGSDYGDNFPVIFNIWFWLMVLLALSVYVTSIGMWNMDPGRDSIIYRLTQQKIKSD